MKKLLLLLLLVVVVWGKPVVFDANELINRVSDTTQDVFSFKFKTKARSDFQISSFNPNILSNFSRCTWILNKTIGEGVFLDETENITSLYKITNFKISKRIINGETTTIIYGEMLSDIGNHYTFLINDYSHVLVITGYAMGHVVIRRFYDLE